MACLFDLEDLFHPSDDFMGRRVRGLVEVDNTVVLEHVNGAVGG